MRSRISEWWFSLLGMGRFSHEAGAAVFQGLRIRLTLWYCGVLAAALLLFGVALYFGVQAALLNPVEDAAVHLAEGQRDRWLTPHPLPTSTPSPTSGPISENGSAAAPMCSSPDAYHPVGPPPPVLGSNLPESVVCFDQNGSLLPNQNTSRIPAAVRTILTDNTLAKQALQTGQPASDIINGGGSDGRFYRYALVVRTSSGTIKGVIMVGESLLVQDNVLALLLALLLPVGSVALLAAGLGGLFLAQRALAPARLAWGRQQRFIGDASHELRTPLTLLRADAEVLLRSRKRVGPEDADLLEDMVTEIHHMSKLLNNMLTLARLDNHAGHQEYEVVKLSEIARAGSRRVQALAGQMGISIEVLVNDAAVTIGDSAQLEQAVLALLDNAIKYNHRGGHITLRTAVKGKQALLEVSDTGIGIKAEHLPHLGERFYRVDKARSRQAGGTGLGLSIVQSFATAHGGTLTLSSVPDQGTTVTLTLPLAQVSRPDHRMEASMLPEQRV